MHDLLLVVCVVGFVSSSVCRNWTQLDVYAGVCTCQGRALVFSRQYDHNYVVGLTP